MNEKLCELWALREANKLSQPQWRELYLLLKSHLKSVALHPNQHWDESPEQWELSGPAEDYLHHFLELKIGLFDATRLVPSASQMSISYFRCGFRNFLRDCYRFLKRVRENKSGPGASAGRKNALVETGLLDPLTHCADEIATDSDFIHVAPDHPADDGWSASDIEAPSHNEQSDTPAQDAEKVVSLDTILLERQCDEFLLRSPNWVRALLRLKLAPVLLGEGELADQKEISLTLGISQASLSRRVRELGLPKITRRKIDAIDLEQSKKSLLGRWLEDRCGVPLRRASEAHIMECLNLLCRRALMDRRYDHER